MGNAVPFGRRNFGRAYVETTIKLDGIEIDDFAAEALGDSYGEPAFSCAGRADEGDEGCCLVRYNRSLGLVDRW